MLLLSMIYIVRIDKNTKASTHSVSYTMGFTSILITPGRVRSLNGPPLCEFHVRIGEARGITQRVYTDEGETDKQLPG